MPLHRIERLPEDLVAPAMVAAFDGWVDAASAASTTAEHLAQGGDLVAAFDADVLYDYRSRRPVLDIIDGTLYQEDGTTYMVFVHEWTQIIDGTIVVPDTPAS